jgi:hypothetical protein
MIVVVAKKIFKSSSVHEFPGTRFNPNFVGILPFKPRPTQS